MHTVHAIYVKSLSTVYLLFILTRSRRSVYANFPAECNALDSNIFAGRRLTLSSRCTQLNVGRVAFVHAAIAGSGGAHRVDNSDL